MSCFFNNSLYLCIGFLCKALEGQEPTLLIYRVRVFCNSSPVFYLNSVYQACEKLVLLLVYQKVGGRRHLCFHKVLKGVLRFEKMFLPLRLTQISICIGYKLLRNILQGKNSYMIQALFFVIRGDVVLRSHHIIYSLSHNNHRKPSVTHVF